MPTMWERMRTPSPNKERGELDDDGDVAMNDTWQYNAHLNQANANNTQRQMGYSYSIRGGPVSSNSRPRPRKFLQVPFESSAPAVREPPPRNPKRLNLSNSTQQQAWRESMLRPASSVYPQPSPRDFDRNHYSMAGHDDISPPSSPEQYAYNDRRAGRHDLPDVSPIDEDLNDMADSLPGPPRDGRSGRAPSREGQIRDQNRPPSRNTTGNTNIPMMRRAKRQQADKAIREMHSREQLRSGATEGAGGSAAAATGPRWDPVTGELTTSSGGRPSQVNPAEYAHGLGISNMSSSPPQKSPTVATSRFGERIRRMARSEQNRDMDPAAGMAAASTRPAWRGASGRTTLVDQLRDKKQSALKLPEKASKRVFSPVSAPAQNSSAGLSLARGQTPPVSPPPGAGRSETLGGSTIRKIVPSSSQLPPPAATQAEPSYSTSARGTSYPSPPNSGNLIGADAPSVAAKQLLAGAINLQPPLQSPTSPHYPDKHIKRKPPPAHAANNFRDSVAASSVYSQQDEQQPPPPPPHNPKAAYIAANEPWVQPPSRFSISTHATSNNGTPRESFDDREDNRPPVPTPPQRFRESPQARQESVMDRKRPVRRGDEEENGRPVDNSPVVISLKDAWMSSPFTSQAARDRKTAASGITANPAVMRARTTVERPTSSASSINKSLPPAPPEASAGEAKDRVGLLNAQLSALGNRRINLNRSIQQMTELMPTDNLMASAAVLQKREMEKQTISNLREELAEVQRQEYEIGLKLHRAYKRMDREAEWEPTTLWVRRVTG